MTKESSIKKSESGSIAVASGKLMVAQMIPFTSRAVYERLLNELFACMNEETLKTYLPQIGDFLHLKKKDSVAYKDSGAETNAILDTFMRLRPYRMHVFKAVREHRQKVGLVV